MTGAACETGNAYTSGASDFTSGFQKRLMLSCHLCIFISGNSLIFWISISLDFLLDVKNKGK